MEIRNEITAYIENVGLVLLGILFFLFPLALTSLTTDPYMLPKQVMLGGIVLILLIFFGAKMISEGAVRIRRTPFDVALLMFGVALLLSSLFAVNRYDSLIAYAPFLLSIFSYFLIVNFIKKAESLSFVLISLVVGASIVSVLAILSFFQLYLFPFEFAKTQTFSPLGSLFDQAMYLVLMLPIAASLALPILKRIGYFIGITEESSETSAEFNQKTTIAAGFLAAVVLIIIGLLITLYELFVLKPAGGLLLLPFEVGFQTAFAAISQDTGRVLQGFLFGSGFGTFLTDFTRFKQAVPFNLDTTLWSMFFIRSSSFVLELLATTGVIGVASFCFVLFQIIKRVRIKLTRENPLFFAMLFVIIASFLLPFSPILQALFILLLALFATAEGLLDEQRFFDVELHFVAFKKGIIPLIASPLHGLTGSAARAEDKSFTRALPVTFFTLFLAAAGIIGFFCYRYVYSDILFQNSLLAYAANNGLQTYNNQTNAINIFPYRDAYHRIYAQTNLALANNIASQQPRDTAPTKETQQTILSLIQQSINSARNATIISPQTSLNWQNLSSVYRSLIGFGKSAEDFAAASSQQAIKLDPNNPQQYINLGGIYYQLARWDDAQQQFQIAINLKPDFANAYYNYGHALESKGDLPNALVYYQSVKTLVANDPPSLEKITGEIAVLEKKISGEAEAAAPKEAPQETKQPLGIDKPTTQLPERKPPVEIPPPTATESAE